MRFNTFLLLFSGETVIYCDKNKHLLAWTLFIGHSIYTLHIIATNMDQEANFFSFLIIQKIKLTKP